ncbi:MAG TPA: (Fe-S)-binding protein [Solirubrobacteraceae bacterium]|nr:(Fe-S)-binding protein [Solirubrobacteraceae bacterium]
MVIEPSSGVRVQLFVTCLVDLLYPEVGERTVALLERLGCEVAFTREQTCCGQPALNSGHPVAARTVAGHFLDAFAETDGPIVAPFGSCVHMVRHHYPRLFADAAPRQRDLARTLGARTTDLASFVVDVLGRSDVGGRYPGSRDDAPVPVAYHHECHLLRGLGVADAPLALLRGVAGCTVVETERGDLCCGFGGTFSLKMSNVSVAMADEKLDRALAAGARAIVSTDVGCLMHLEGRARRRRLPLAVHHLVDLLEPDGRL